MNLIKSKIEYSEQQTSLGERNMMKNIKLMIY